MKAEEGKLRNKSDESGFHPISTLKEEIDQLFDRFSWPELTPYFRKITGRSRPSTEMFFQGAAVDVSESEDAFEIYAEFPGVGEEDVEVTIVNGRLLLKGEKHDEREETDRKKRYHIKERSFGSFQRVFEIPPEVDQGNIQAKFKKGVLRITLPKTKEAIQQERRIQIKT